MEIKMQFQNWEDRRKFLGELQDAIGEQFGFENYKVYVFGSFITEQYRDGESDIDIAVYSPQWELMREIVDFIHEYMERIKFPCDVILIDVSHRHAYVDLEPLLHGIAFTDFTTEDLEIYKRSLFISNLWKNEEKRWIQGLFPYKHTDGTLEYSH